MPCLPDDVLSILFVNLSSSNPTDRRRGTMIICINSGKEGEMGWGGIASR